MSNATVETIASDYAHELVLPNGETIRLRGSDAATTTHEESAAQLSRLIKASVGL